MQHKGKKEKKGDSQNTKERSKNLFKKIKRDFNFLCCCCAFFFLFLKGKFFVLLFFYFVVYCVIFFFLPICIFSNANSNTYHLFLIPFSPIRFHIFVLRCFVFFLFFRTRIMKHIFSNKVFFDVNLCKICVACTSITSSSFSR